MPSVQVTLTYASLEDAIVDLAKLRAAAKPADKPDPKAETPAPAPKTAKKDKAEPAPTLDYDKDVAPVIAKAVAGNRAEVIETLTRFGAKTGKQIKPEDYSDFLEQLANRIDAVKAKAETADLT